MTQGASTCLAFRIFPNDREHRSGPNQTPKVGFGGMNRRRYRVKEVSVQGSKADHPHLRIQ
jgi:hypothetical protein